VRSALTIRFPRGSSKAIGRIVPCSCYLTTFSRLNDCRANVSRKGGKTYALLSLWSYGRGSLAS
jgi:hypothetical protein